MREGSGNGDQPAELQSGGPTRHSESDSEDVFSLAPCAACYSQKVNAMYRRGGSSSSSEYCASASEQEESEEEESTSRGSSSSGDDAAEQPHAHIISHRPDSDGRGDDERQVVEETLEKSSSLPSLRTHSPRLLPSSLLPRPSPKALSTFHMQLVPKAYNSDAFHAIQTPSRVNAEMGGVENLQQPPPPQPLQWWSTRPPYSPMSMSQPFPSAQAPMFPPPLLHASIPGPHERLHALVPQPCCYCHQVHCPDPYCSFHGGMQMLGWRSFSDPRLL